MISQSNRVLPSLVSALFLAVLPLSAAPVVEPAPTPTPGPPPAAATWLERVSPATPGVFPPPRSFVASYRLTWADIEAAHADIRCVSDEAENTIRTSVKTASVGGARLLYKFDGLATSVADRRTLRPVRLDQKDEHGGKRSVSHVVFTAEGATRTTDEDSKAPKAPAHGTAPQAVRPRLISYPGVMDIHSTLLTIRSQPLAVGDEKKFIVMSATTPYLATIKVVRRERVKVKAGDYAAIRCSVSLQKISKRGELEAYKSLKEAFAWISDDADRLIIKVETQIFIGSVNMEMEKVSFPGGAPR